MLHTARPLDASDFALLLSLLRRAAPVLACEGCAERRVGAFIATVDFVAAVNAGSSDCATDCDQHAPF